MGSALHTPARLVIDETKRHSSSNLPEKPDAPNCCPGWRQLVPLLGMAIIMTTPSGAADPITGTWKLDLAKSKFAVPPPKEQTEVYRELPSGQIELTLSRVQSDGASTTTRLSWPSTGGGVHDVDGRLPKDVTIIETLLGQGDWLVTYLRNGKQYLTMHKLISEDGKTMVQTIKGLDAQGRPAEQLQVLRRQ